MDLILVDTAFLAGKRDGCGFSIFFKICEVLILSAHYEIIKPSTNMRIAKRNKCGSFFRYVNQFAISAFYNFIILQCLSTNKICFFKFNGDCRTLDRWRRLDLSCI